MHVGSRDGSGADPSGPIWLLCPFTPKAGENGTRRAANYGPLGMATLDGGFVGDAETRRNGVAGIARHRRSSPESEEGALPLIDTDNTDQEKGAGKWSTGRRVPPQKPRPGLLGTPGGAT
jgi:hypothetical protein